MSMSQEILCLVSILPPFLSNPSNRVKKTPEELVALALSFGISCDIIPDCISSTAGDLSACVEEGRITCPFGPSLTLRKWHQSWWIDKVTI